MQIDHRAFPPQITGSISEVLHANRWATLGSPSLRPTLNCLFVWLSTGPQFCFGFGFCLCLLGSFSLYAPIPSPPCLSRPQSAPEMWPGSHADRGAIHFLRVVSGCCGFLIPMLSFFGPFRIAAPSCVVHLPSSLPLHPSVNVLHAHTYIGYVLYRADRHCAPSAWWRLGKG
jgi:hypothetical protein